MKRVGRGAGAGGARGPAGWGAGRASGKRVGAAVSARCLLASQDGESERLVGADSKGQVAG